MPLDNTASIKEIITSLQSMEGINAKADLASVIGEPAQSSDTMATMVNHIQIAKNELATKMGDSTKATEPLQSLVGGLVVGKKWASGQIEVSTGGVLTAITHNLGVVPSVAIGVKGGTSYVLAYKLRTPSSEEITISVRLNGTTFNSGGSNFTESTISMIFPSAGTYNWYVYE